MVRVPAALPRLRFQVMHIDLRDVYFVLEIQMQLVGNKKGCGSDCTMELPRCGSFLLEQALVIEDGFVKNIIKIFQIEYKVMIK